jgi:predicted O-methyltransferase YrrM
MLRGSVDKTYKFGGGGWVVVQSAAKWVLRQILRVPAVRQYLQSQIADEPTIRFAPPGHFYSPLPDLGQIEKEVGRLYSYPSADDGVQLNPDEQRRLLVALAEYHAAFDWGEQATPGRRFFLKNNRFQHGDAVVLYAMIRHFRPRRIIEVGSGFSSALMLDTNDRHGDLRMDLCFIEPYPDRLKSLLKEDDSTSTRLITAPVQEIPLAEFDALDQNDILFIDSSHVAKAGSDVNYLFFSVLPRLRHGVLIHIHDIFYPFEYPLTWLREGRAWNELYFLRAFLQYNPAFEIIFFNSYLGHQSPELIKEHLPLMGVNPGGSIWLRKTRYSREP